MGAGGAQVRGVDFLSAALAVGLGSASVADMAYLNLQERATELAALAAAGWQRRQLAHVLLAEAAVTGLVATALGAVAGLALAAFAFGQLPQAPSAAVVCGASAFVLVLAVTRVMLAAVTRRPITAMLAQEESPVTVTENSNLAGLPVRFTSVRQTYRTGAGISLRALDDITLHIPAGQAVAVTGPSGSGKSTLLHLAGAMDSPDTGVITIGSSDLTEMSERERAVFRRRVGFVFQRFHLLPALTALDNVTAPVLPFKMSFDKRARARGLLAQVGLEGREHDLPAKMSGGQQQRVAIARALINGPGLLLADEPTGNLDSQTGAAVMDLLFQLRDLQGLALVIATHDTALAARRERLVHLTDGKVVTDETCATAKTTPGAIR